jgi:hypothetical protein
MANRVKVPGRGWAYTGAILGGLVSIAANVAHSFIPPHGVAANWRPEVGAVIGAVVWPVFLFVALEIFVRVRWPRGVTWWLARWVGLLPVAGLAALVSYRHLSGLLAHYGEEPIVYYAGPLAVDGLMVMATGALVAASRYRKTNAPEETPAQPVPVPATPSIIAAPSGSVAPSPIQPPTVPAAKPEPAPPVPAAPTPAVVATRAAATRPTRDQAASAPVSRPGTRAATRPRPSKTSRPAAKPAPSAQTPPVATADRAPLTPPLDRALLARVRDVATEYRKEHGSPITPGQLAVRLKVTSEQANQALAVLNLTPDSSTAGAQTVNGKPAKATR